MQRIPIQPRDNWQATVESQGFHFHSIDDQPYWNESAYYQFTSAEVDELEKATYALNDLCLKAVQHVIDEKLFDIFQIPPQYIPWLSKSWDQEEFTVYGRFDLAYDGTSPPKLLEYNADTPTSLLEAAVVQWFWMKDVFPRLDQFNSIHERLIEAFTTFRPELGKQLYFTCMADSMEDFMTTNYLRDTAMQAGFETQFIPLERLGFNHGRRIFVDENENAIQNCFKLYPWEWMLREEFGQYLLLNTTRWLEAPWKMILSNKAILTVLSDLFPDSPHILKADFQPLNVPHVRKPIYSREGANVALFVPGEDEHETEGPYKAPYVYQQYAPLPEFQGNHPVVGSWLINGYAAGIGIREDQSKITGNLSRFVPHVFS
jgi:glutathionylspermidine synthase